MSMQLFSLFQIVLTIDFNFFLLNRNNSLIEIVFVESEPKKIKFTCTQLRKMICKNFINYIDFCIFVVEILEMRKIMNQKD